MTTKEIANAVKSIINTDNDSTNEKHLIVSNKEDAETLSQLFLDAETGGGSITGPYLQAINGSPTRIWYVDK